MLLFVLLSGAQFNPAVSLAAFLSGLMAFDMMILYILAQLAGGTASAAIAYVLILDYPQGLNYLIKFVCLFVFTGSDQQHCSPS